MRVALLLCLCACGARTDLGRGPRLDAGAVRDLGADARGPRDLGVESDTSVLPDMPETLDAGPRTTCAGSMGPTSMTLCTQRVRMGDVARSDPFCFVDIRPMPGEEGTLTFDCEGGGAELVFDGGARFVGTSTGTDIDVCTGTEFDYSDGCHWQSAQHVSGSRLDGAFTLTYAERATTGSACAPACGATANVAIE